MNKGVLNQKTPILLLPSLLRLLVKQSHIRGSGIDHWLYHKYKKQCFVRILSYDDIKIILFTWSPENNQRFPFQHLFFSQLLWDFGARQTQKRLQHIILGFRDTLRTFLVWLLFKLACWGECCLYGLLQKTGFPPIYASECLPAFKGTNLWPLEEYAGDLSKLVILPNDFISLLFQPLTQLISQVANLLLCKSGDMEFSTAKDLQMLFGLLLI